MSVVVGMPTHDRVALAALAAADVGAGLYLIGAHSPVWVHALVGVLALLLAFPTTAAAAVGRLPALADEGVLVNAGVLTFMALEVAFIAPGSGLQRAGLAVLLAAAAAATLGLYVRLFGALQAAKRADRRGRRAGGDRE